jgi:hypothetical protein
LARWDDPPLAAGPHGLGLLESVGAMKVRAAIVFYVLALLFMLAVPWAIALYSDDWRAGMALMTVFLIQHAWREVRRMLRNKP